MSSLKNNVSISSEQSGKSFKKLRSNLSSNYMDQSNPENELALEDKLKIIDECFQRMQDHKEKQYQKIMSLKGTTKSYETEINELKNKVKMWSIKIDEWTISRDELAKQITIKNVYIKNQKHEKIQSNDVIIDDIQYYNQSIKDMTEEIKEWSMRSMQENVEIEALKKRIEEAKKKNNWLKKERDELLKRKEIEEKNIVRINDQIMAQETASQHFLEGLERKVDLLYQNDDDNNEYDEEGEEGEEEKM